MHLPVISFHATFVYFVTYPPHCRYTLLYARSTSPQKPLHLLKIIYHEFGH